MLEINGLEISWIFVESTKGSETWSQTWNLLSMIQYFQKRQLNSTRIKSRIAEKPKFHHLLHKMMAKYMLKRNHCIYCSEDHKSDSCNAFLNQTLKERIHFLELKFAMEVCSQWKMSITQSHAIRGCHV